MDLSTLSRQLNMSVHELRDQMKQAGYHISPRARKVDNNLARTLLQKFSKKPAQEASPIVVRVAKIQVPSFLTVKDLAAKLDQPVSAVIKKLIENGVMASINEEIDADTAGIIAAEFGAETESEKSGPESGARLGLGYVAEQ